MTDGALTGLFTLGGVIIGGGITMGTTVWQMTKQERARQSEQERIRSSTFRTAARLVQYEFRLARGLTIVAMEQKSLAGMKVNPIQLQAWDTYRGALADAITQESEWALMANAVVTCTGVREIVRMFPDHVPSPAMLTLSNLVQTCEAAEQCLDRLMTTMCQPA